MKSSKPPPKDDCFCVCAGRVCTGGDVGASKKLPPPPKDVEAGFGAAAEARGDLIPLSRPAKGDGFRACGGGEEKLRLEKASFMPPNAPPCAGGDCGIPKDPDCEGACCACGCGGGVGLEAYSERMDCLRSTRGGPLPATEGLLDGRAGDAAVGPARKSNPSSESAGCAGFGAALAFGGGGAVLVGGPVLGRAGAEMGSSPKRSTFCARCGARVADAVLVPDARCEADRSIFAFSWTTLRGCGCQWTFDVPVMKHLPHHHLHQHPR